MKISILYRVEYSLARSIDNASNFPGSLNSVLSNSFRLASRDNCICS